MDKLLYAVTIWYTLRKKLYNFFPYKQDGTPTVIFQRTKHVDNLKMMQQGYINSRFYQFFFPKCVQYLVKLFAEIANTMFHTLKIKNLFCIRNEILQ